MISTMSAAIIAGAAAATSERKSVNKFDSVPIRSDIYITGQIFRKISIRNLLSNFYLTEVVVEIR